MNLPAMHFPKRIAFEDFLGAIDEDTHVEWVDGRVLPMTPVSRRHDEIVGFIYAILRGFIRRTKAGGIAFHDSFQMKLGAARSSRVPDVGYVRPERAHLMGDTFLDGPADLVVEVVSPESRTRDKVEKFRVYEGAGVPEYWLVDPARRTAEVYRLTPEGSYRPAEPVNAGRLECEALPGFWIDVAWLWQDEPDEWVAYAAWGLI